MRLNSSVKLAFPSLVIALACLLPVSVDAQESQFITLDPPTGLDLRAHTMDSKGNLLPPAPANFRRLGEAHAGEPAEMRTLTLRFRQTVRITGISVSKDFKLEPGGSCVEGDVYAKDSTCQLFVRFTPQGPGTRLGKLTVSHSGSATPDFFGLGGTASMPVLSFIPSIITTVPGTYPSSKGLLNNVQQIDVDYGDRIVIADTGNNVIRYIDSSGAIKTIASGVTDPVGIGVDPYGNVFFSEPSANAIEFLAEASTTPVKANGTGSDTCTYAVCLLANEAVTSPGQISIDPYFNMYFANNPSTYGAAYSLVQPEPTFENRDDVIPAQEDYPTALAAYVGPTLFTFLHNTADANCQIVSANAETTGGDPNDYTNIVGGRTCGFSGDGGLAQNAEISTKVGEIVFDAGGNMYFTDTNNHRVRRVDVVSGIIRTIAGDGTAGYTCDGCGSTVAELYYPEGVGVDSQGQVYIVSGTGAGNAQVIRKVTATGVRYLGSVLKGTPSPASIVLVTNTGTYPLQLASTVFTGANPGDFSIDPDTTSCILQTGATLEEGRTCQIGFICTPTAGGTRTANFVALDNSANNSNTINLSCTGTLPSAAVSITSPAKNASVSSGTAVSFAVHVASSSGPAPTGKVQFKVDGANYGSPVTILSGGASINITGLTQASHTLMATYSGDTNYAPGGPISESISVIAATHATGVTLLPALMETSSTCQRLSFQVAVTGQTGAVPTGSVELLAGQSEVASSALAGGRAVLTAPILHPGTYSFTARYGGDAHNQPAVSPALIQTVSPLGGCSQPSVSAR